MIFGILMILFGLKIFTQFPLADPNNAFIEFLGSALPPSIVALLSIFIVASIFSTADTELFLSSILVGKLIRGDKEIGSSISQLLIWLISLAGVIVGIYFTSLVDIYFVLLFAFMIVGVVMLARLLGRGSDNTAFWGMLVSLILLIVMILTGRLDGAYPLLLIVPPAIAFLVRAKK